MSAGSLLREALAHLRALDLPASATDPVIRALEADGEGRSFLADAAWEALPGQAARVRGAGVVLVHAASNLGDDLSDGEATYLERPFQLAPAVQWTLQHLGTSLLLESGVLPSTLARASRLLARAGGWAVEEWASPSWNSARYASFAEGIAGLQLEAYLGLLWDGTSLESRAAEVGIPLGASSLVVADIAEGKPRWRALPKDDQVQVEALLSSWREPLRTAPERCIQQATRPSWGSSR